MLFSADNWHKKGFVCIQGHASASYEMEASQNYIQQMFCKQLPPKVEVQPKAPASSGGHALPCAKHFVAQVECKSLADMLPATSVHQLFGHSKGLA